MRRGKLGGAGSRRLAVIVGAIVTLVAAVSVATATTPFWGTPSAVGLPSTNVDTPGDQYASFDDVACASVGNCTAVGDYRDASEDYRALAAIETNGVWAAGTEIVAPGNADSSDPDAGLLWVSCWSVGNCVGVGQYMDNESVPALQAMYAVETDGVWAQAVEPTLPSNHDTSDTSGEAQNAELAGVSCTGPDDCVATGYYRDDTSPYNQLPLIATDSSGTWSASHPLLPGTATGTSQRAALNGVDCTSASSCVAVGEYLNTSANAQPMVDTYSAGSWQQAAALVLPGNATGTSGDQNAVLYDVACSDGSNCDAVGGYDLAAGSPVPLSISETAGAWQTGVEVQLPGGAGTQADYFTDLEGVSCPATGACEASGWYLDGSTDLQPMLADEQGGSWAPATESPLPADQYPPGTADPYYAWWGGIDCLSPGVCVVGGTYENSAGGNVPMVQSSLPTLAVTTSSLAGAAIGSPYSQTLSASGGAGAYTWKLASGTLPAGLTLNTTTGVISGTPTVGGTSTFTVSVSNPGPPAQTATTGQLSITVGAPSFAANTTTSPTQVTVTVGCSAPAGAVCNGTASLSSIEHLLSGKIVAVAARHHRKHKRTLTIDDGSASFSVLGGSTEVVVIQLSSAARKALATKHVLPAQLALTPAGTNVPLTSITVTIHLPTHKKHKHKHKH